MRWGCIVPQVSRALKRLRARHRLILTGTPIQNRVCELWSLFDFLLPDYLGSESSFNARFARPVAASRDQKASKSDQRSGEWVTDLFARGWVGVVCLFVHDRPHLDV